VNEFRRYDKIAPNAKCQQVLVLVPCTAIGCSLWLVGFRQPIPLTPRQEVLRQSITKTKLTLILTLTLAPALALPTLLTLLNPTNPNRSSAMMKLASCRRGIIGCRVDPPKMRLLPERGY